MSENKLRYQIIQEFQNILHCICCTITQSFNVLNMLVAVLHKGHTVASSQSFVHTAQIILCLLKLFCVFQFSSLKWLLPQLLTTQVLVIRGLFCVGLLTKLSTLTQGIIICLLNLLY